MGIEIPSNISPTAAFFGAAGAVLAMQARGLIRALTKRLTGEDDEDENHKADDRLYSMYDRRIIELQAETAQLRTELRTATSQLDEARRLYAEAEQKHRNCEERLSGLNALVERLTRRGAADITGDG